MPRVSGMCMEQFGLFVLFLPSRSYVIIAFCVQALIISENQNLILLAW